MLYPAVVFSLLALVAGAFGFTRLDAQMMEPARLVFCASLVIALLAFLESRKGNETKEA